MTGLLTLIVFLLLVLIGILSSNKIKGFVGKFIERGLELLQFILLWGFVLAVFILIVFLFYPILTFFYESILQKMITTIKPLSDKYQGWLWPVIVTSYCLIFIFALLEDKTEKQKKSQADKILKKS